MKQIFINIALALLGITAICFSLLKIMPFEITEETYIGVIVSLLGLATTFIIGYQIYNAIEFKNELSTLRKRYEEAVVKNEELEKKFIQQNYQTQEGFDIISMFINKIEDQTPASAANSFYILHHALISSLDSGRTEYEWIFEKLREFICQLSGNTFAYGLGRRSDGVWFITSNVENELKPLKEVISAYTHPIQTEETIIRNKQNFCNIQIEYNRIIRLFYKRLKEIELHPDKQITQEEKNMILGLF